MSFNLFEHYFPALDELSADELQSARARMQAWLQPGAPSLDMRPGSVFGASALEPLSIAIAGVEKAFDRVRNDHNVAVVGADTVYDCDYVENYLKALGGVRQESVVTNGYMLLQFDLDADRIIPAGVQFLFNTADILLARVEQYSPISILRSGSTRVAVNEFVLTPYTSTTYAVLVPVQGTPSQVITAGEEAKTSQVIDGLVKASAAQTFVTGRSNNSVPAIARRATQAFAASGFITRDGSREQLIKSWPDLISVAALLSGDPEQLRGAVNPLGIAAGAVDILVRSQAKTTFTQTIRVNFYEQQDNTAVDKFIGNWQPVATPIRLVDVRWVGDVTIDLMGDKNVTLFSQSENSERAPLLTCAYSELEKFTLVVNMPRAANNAPLIITEFDPEGQAYALFDITFVGDPAVVAVQRYVDAESPAGVNVLVKAPCPVIFEHFEVGYTRIPGTVFNLAQAISETSSYLQDMTAPARFSEAKIYDIAYYAGADDVTASNIRARLRLSVADRLLPVGQYDLAADYAGGLAASLKVPDIVITDIRALIPAYRDPLTGGEGSRMGVATFRNTSYEMPDGVVSFQPHQILTT